VIGDIHDAQVRQSVSARHGHFNAALKTTRRLQIELCAVRPAFELSGDPVVRMMGLLPVFGSLNGGYQYVVAQWSWARAWGFRITGALAFQLLYTASNMTGGKRLGRKKRDGSYETRNLTRVVYFQDIVLSGCVIVLEHRGFCVCYRCNSPHGYETHRMPMFVFNEEHGEASVQSTNALCDAFHTRYVLDADLKAQRSRAILRTMARMDKREKKPSLWQPEHLRTPELVDVFLHECCFQQHQHPPKWDWRAKILGELGLFAAKHEEYRKWFRISDEGSVLLCLNEESDDAFVLCRCVTARTVDEMRQRRYRQITEADCVAVSDG